MRLGQKPFETGMKYSLFLTPKTQQFLASYVRKNMQKRVKVDPNQRRAASRSVQVEAVLLKKFVNLR